MYAIRSYYVSIVQRPRPRRSRSMDLKGFDECPDTGGVRLQFVDRSLGGEIPILRCQVDNGGDDPLARFVVVDLDVAHRVAIRLELGNLRGDLV